MATRVLQSLALAGAVALVSLPASAAQQTANLPINAISVEPTGIVVSLDGGFNQGYRAGFNGCRALTDREFDALMTAWAAGRKVKLFYSTPSKQIRCIEGLSLRA